MRKETSSQFTEGIVSDLNPINTPNTVLTDALNATIITYDGNEHSLQNDRGNYPLENCRLKPNYIPVGLKEYGNILYIVSYNPLDNHVEIGSYPSPLQVESSDISNTNLKLDSVIGNIQEDVKYSDLVEKCKTHVWISGNEEDSKLYPGDEYKIDIPKTNSYKYEGLEFLIIDENRQKYNITDVVVPDNKWHPVAWQIPGWLAAQYRLGLFDDFIMSVRSAEIPQLKINEQISGKINLNFQIKISDKLFLAAQGESDIRSDLFIKICLKVNNTEEDIYDVSLADSVFIDWNGDAKILWKNFSIDFDDAKFGDTLSIEAFPVLSVNVNDSIKNIFYNDIFVENISIPLVSIGSYSDFTFADKLWKFYIDPDSKDKLYLEYNVQGPVVTKSSVQLYYRIYDIKNKLILDWQPLKNYSGITEQGFGTINFDDTFTSEEIYKFEFTFYEAGKTPTKNNKIFTKLIVASEIFYKFIDKYTIYDDITFDDWAPLYTDTIVLEDIDITHSNTKIDNLIQSNYKWNTSGDLVNTKNSVLDDLSLRSLWNKNLMEAPVIQDSQLNDVLGKPIEFNRYYYGKEEFNITPKLQVMDKGLWKNLSKPKLLLKSNIDVNRFSEDLINSDPLKVDITVKYGAKKLYDYVVRRDVEQINYRKLESVPLLWIDANCVFLQSMNRGVEFNLLNCGKFIKDGDSYKLDFKKLNELDEDTETRELDTILTEEIDNGIYLPNKLAEKIVTALGPSDIGILGLGLRNSSVSDSFQLRHGTEIMQTFDRKVSDTFLFTYLVIRDNPGSNEHLVFIPIEEDSGLWNVKISAELYMRQGWLMEEDSMGDIRNKLSTYGTQFLNNIAICDNKKSLTKGSYLQINTNNTIETFPIASIACYVPESNRWNYNGYNLLDSDIRNKILNIIGIENSNLLSGLTTELPRISLYNSDILNNSVAVNNIFNSIDTQINGVINNRTENDLIYSNTLRDQILSRQNQKGVYWLGNKLSNIELIDLLNTNYSNTDYLKLYTNDINLENLNIYIKRGKLVDDLMIYWLTDTHEYEFGKVHNKIKFTWT